MSNKERFVTLLYFSLAVLVGVVSAFMNTNFSILVGILVLAGTTYLLMVRMKKKVKWFLGNGAILYVFFWIITWTLMLGYQ